MPSSNKLKITELEFDEIKTNLINYLKGQQEFQDYDFEGSGMAVLMDLLAYNTHYMGYYANMLGNEMFLDSSLLRASAVAHAKSLGYLPASMRASTATISVTLSDSIPSGQRLTKKIREFSKKIPIFVGVKEFKNGTRAKFDANVIDDINALSQLPKIIKSKKKN